MREVLRRYFQVSAAMRRTALDKGFVKGFPKGEFMLLQMIADAQQAGEPITMSQISQRLGVTKSAVSQMTKNIEEAYINRTVDEKDRRKVYITLTEKGKKFLQKRNQHTIAVFDKIIEELGEDDSYEMLRILERITDIIEQKL